MNAKKIATEHWLEHWSEIIKSRSASGLNVIDFCKSRGISKDQYYYWQRKLRDGVRGELTKATVPQNPLLPGMFAEVVVAGFERSGEDHENTTGNARDEIKVEIPGMKIVAGSAYPPDALAALLKGLVRTC